MLTEQFFVTSVNFQLHSQRKNKLPHDTDKGHGIHKKNKSCKMPKTKNEACHRLNKDEVSLSQTKDKVSLSQTKDKVSLSQTKDKVSLSQTKDEVSLSQTKD